MTREQARQRQEELFMERNMLIAQHVELVDAVSRVHRDIAELTKELDAIDTRLEYDGTSFQTKPPAIPTSFNEIMNIFDNLSVRK